MILHRITQHVKDQNWTAIAIDFVIVVVGVFIGIQVSNWNQAAADRREQRRLLSELAADLAADIDEIDAVRRAAGIRVKAIEDLLEDADGTVRKTLPESAFRFVPDTDAAGRYSEIPEYEHESPFDYPIASTFIRTLDGNRHTYETLLNVNGFRLIKDRDLVRAIQTYYARVDEVRDLEDFVVDSRNGIFNQLHRHGISRTSQIHFDKLREVVRDDATLSAALGDVQYSSFNQWDAMHSLQQQAQELMRLLEDVQ